LLSFVGATDSSSSHIQIIPGSESVPDPVQSEQTPSTSTYADVSSCPITRIPGVDAGHVTMREAAVTSTYMEKAESDRREASFIVSGLPTSNSASDRECVLSLTESEFDVRPVVSITKRLGQRSSNKPQPLLFYLKDTTQAQQVVSQARRLRHSQDEYVRQMVFINKNLTKAAARAAYELWCRRRQSSSYSGSQSRDLVQSLSASAPTHSVVMHSAGTPSSASRVYPVSSDGQSDRHRGMSSSLNVEVPPFVPCTQQV